MCRFFSVPLNLQECETKIAQEIASLSKEDVSKEEMSENEEEVINLLLAQVRPPARVSDAGSNLKWLHR